ncbi:hypothetical protein [Streptomyces sp. NPDC055036]
MATIEVGTIKLAVSHREFELIKTGLALIDRYGDYGDEDEAGKLIKEMEAHNA